MSPTTFDKDKLYLVADMPGYSPHVGRLLSMMNYARYTTWRAVQGLGVEELDTVTDVSRNSIAMLLRHFAAVEYAYQVQTFEERRLNESERAEWGPALNLGDEGRASLSGRDMDHHWHVLQSVRDRTLALFREVDDAWLATEKPFWQGHPANYHFMWYHVFEDEINHRGQIRLIRQRLEVSRHG
ncbi:DUF664 domain-containing protein [Cohnella sp. REN36]|uniref:mycothiol transferase n=1 Tax=Cohnella sp. REN36 TaxID=2887347 RepID=UPI00351CBBB0